MQITLPRLREEHLPLVMDWRMRPYITKYMNTDPVLTMDGQRRWFARVDKDDSQKNWIVCADGRPVGLINLVDIDPVNRRCGWGYYIAEKDVRSLQLATSLEWSLYDYVFETLGLNKLTNEVFVENKYVIQLHELCGGHQEGILRQHVCKNGVFHDVSVGAILAEEWAAFKQGLEYEHFTFE